MLKCIDRFSRRIHRTKIPQSRQRNLHAPRNSLEKRLRWDPWYAALLLKKFGTDGLPHCTSLRRQGTKKPVSIWRTTAFIPLLVERAVTKKNAQWFDYLSQFVWTPTNRRCTQFMKRENIFVYAKIASEFNVRRNPQCNQDVSLP